MNLADELRWNQALLIRAVSLALMFQIGCSPPLIHYSDGQRVLEMELMFSWSEEKKMLNFRSTVSTKAEERGALSFAPTLFPSFSKHSPIYLSIFLSMHLSVEDSDSVDIRERGNGTTRHG